MDIRAFLSQNAVIIDVRASDKVQLLKDLSARAAPEVALEPALVSTEILKREELGSTGLGSGVAIPHARIAGLSKPYGVLARLKRALDFAAIDGDSDHGRRFLAERLEVGAEVRRAKPPAKFDDADGLASGIRWLRKLIELRNLYGREGGSGCGVGPGEPPGLRGA